MGIEKKFSCHAILSRGRIYAFLSGNWTPKLCFQSPFEVLSFVIVCHAIDVTPESTVLQTASLFNRLVVQWPKSITHDLGNR
jgi:hypothetical protein